MSATDLIIGLVLLIVIGMTVHNWHHDRAREIIDAWAGKEGYTLVSKRHRVRFISPFWFRTFRGQEVYYVVVRAPNGDEGEAFVRCGGFGVGMFSDEITVHWTKVLGAARA
jgi:hypothetical protein